MRFVYQTHGLSSSAPGPRLRNGTTFGMLTDNHTTFAFSDRLVHVRISETNNYENLGPVCSFILVPHVLMLTFASTSDDGCYL